MTPSSAWDAVVVGAGPAGSATAARLAGAGHRVLLLDREDFPRAKPCGECVSPAAVRALDRLGVLHAVREEAHARLHGWRVNPSHGSAFTGSFPTGTHGIGISRQLMDAVLVRYAQHCGAEVRTGAKVTDLIRVGGSVRGVRLGRDQEEVRARLVVGADGLRSVVVRRLGLLRRAPRLRKLALTAHLRGIEDLAGRGELHTFPWGCIGVAEVGGGVFNVTVVVGDALTDAVAGAREQFFDGILRGYPRLAAAARVGEVLATGPFDWPIRRAVHDGALLVGDAAGYFDPFTGQGIFRALRGAELAAAVASQALRKGDATRGALWPYERARRRAFAAGERLQHLIEAFLSRPRLLSWLAGRLHRRPELADALIAVTGDLWPARSLLSPALLANLVR